MHQSRLVKLLIPTTSQLLVCLVLALMLQASVFQSLVLPYFFNSNSLVPYLDTGKQLGLSHLNNFAFVRLIVQGAFWAVVGLCAYVIYLGLVNAIVEARNEVVVSTEFANKGKRGSRLLSLRWPLGLLAGFVAVVWLTAKIGFNLWLGLTGQLITGGVTMWHILAAIASLLGLATNLYILLILAEAAVTADR